MTPELQKYYEERFSMMATTGWSDLMEDIDNMIAALNNISGIKTEKKRLRDITNIVDSAENIKVLKNLKV